MCGHRLVTVPSVTTAPPAWAPTDSISPLDDKLGIRITDYDPDRMVATMPVAGNEQPYGLLHGGATCSLIETIGSWAAALLQGVQGGTGGVEQLHAAVAVDPAAVCRPVDQREVEAGAAHPGVVPADLEGQVRRVAARRGRPGRSRTVFAAGCRVRAGGGVVDDWRRCRHHGRRGRRSSRRRVRRGLAADGGRQDDAAGGEQPPGPAGQDPCHLESPSRGRDPHHLLASL